ncbi:sensor histidine kinase [Dyadobacter sp. CY312]|uniref:sensor histidine kinase n=1 Tax=Dyadobacter sp. CY312 TaxID=2907303 RepID=UPI001F335C82|nr:histidine kinase [Dyadobacter sp. CY312]MCE7044544.1 histidine kinase [Dyadobacter sp. CY312]
MDRHARHFPLRYILQPQTRARRIRYHIVFWLVFILFHLLYFVGSKERIGHSTSWVISYVIYYLRFIPVYYLAAAVFNCLKEKYYGTKLMMLTGMLMVLIMHAANVAVFYLLDKLFGLGSLSGTFQQFGNMYLLSASENGYEDWLMLLIYDVTEMQLLFLPLGLKMIQYGLKEQIEKKDLLAEKLKSELAILRTQPAPHFILNTLNSVLAELLDVSEKASEYLVSLTDVLRFTLYETVDELIDFEREWQALLHFTDLESKRFADRLKVSVKQNGQIPKGAKVPTLVVFTLTENAFKHGVYPTIEDCRVDIELSVNADHLTFRISNSKPALYFNADHQQRSGIGLDNIRKRLELRFKNRYSLQVCDHQQLYSIILKMAFAENPSS